MRVDDIPMVCISLERRPDRWRTFQRYAQAANIEVQRFLAVDARTFDAETHPSISVGTAHNIKYHMRRSHYEIDAAGAVGASLSHIKVWETVRDGSAPAVIVFEDDAPIIPDFKPRLARVLQQLPSQWDLVQFQLTEWDDGSTGCTPIAGKSPWQSCTALMGAYAYMISREGARKMLERAYPIELHVDAYMAYMARLGHIQMLWHPLINIPGPDNGSDIAHGDTRILNVPTNMEKYSMIALSTGSIIGLMAIAAVAGGIVAVSVSKAR